MTEIVVAAAQLPACGDDLDQNLDVVATAVAEAAAAGARLLVLPELATTPYFAGEPAQDYRHWAQPIPGPHSDRIADLAAALDVTVVLPIFEYDAADDTFHNSAVVLNNGAIVPAVDRTGATHPVARKLHLPVGNEPTPGFDEQAHFTAGQWLGVHSLDTYRLGTLVCYDRRFPECWRELRALSADLVAVPVAASGGDSVSFFLAELRTHARENGLFAVVANKVGTELVGGHPIDNYGESCIVGPDGEIIARREGDEGPGLVIAEIDLVALQHIRRSLQYFTHRRTDLFPSPQEVS
ncbi:carbon-nitrogen hydrolase family protein [Mycolicibacterium boenickei]